MLDVLRRLPGILAWMRAPTTIVWYRGGSLLALSARERRPRVTVEKDHAFDIVLAFAQLAAKFVGKPCTAPRCTTEFLAVRRRRFCSPTCSARARMHRYRKLRTRHGSRRRSA
jgi:hypothetical protein